MAIDWDSLQGVSGAMADKAGRRSEDRLATSIDDDGSVLRTPLGEVA